MGGQYSRATEINGNHRGQVESRNNCFKGQEVWFDFMKKSETKIQHYEGSRVERGAMSCGWWLIGIGFDSLLWVIVVLGIGQD